MGVYFKKLLKIISPIGWSESARLYLKISLAVELIIKGFNGFREQP